MDYPPRKPMWGYTRTFASAAIWFVGIAACPVLLDAWNSWYPERAIDYRIRLEAPPVNYVPLLIMLAGLACGFAAVIREMRKDSDRYFNIVESHYGIKAALHTLKELLREGNRIWSDAPAHPHVDDYPATMRDIQAWKTRYDDWKERVVYALSEQFTTQDAERFKRIDESAEIGADVSRLQEMRGMLGGLKQHMANLDQIINDREAPITSA